MASRFSRYRKGLSFFDALNFYRQRKSKKDSYVSLSFLKHPVFLRNIRSDELMFEQLFISKDYAVNVPFEPETIIDLGANVGFASIYFANRFPNSRIIALEPETANFQAAQKNVQPYKNIQLLHAAVWNKEMEVDVVDNGYGEAAFMIEENAEIATNKVPAYTIPHLMQMAGAKNHVDIIKMDIEGSEKDLFEFGYEEWLPNVKLLIVETHDRYKPGCSNALFKAVGKYDFSLELSGENMILYNNQLCKAY